MGVPSSGRVVLLYRQLLKQGKALQYTDYDFFRRSVRREFEQQKDEVEIKVIKEQFEVKQRCTMTPVFFFQGVQHIIFFFVYVFIAACSYTA